MNLFIDSISSPAYVCLFDTKRNIIAESICEIQGNESSKLIPQLQYFLDENNTNQDDIENIIAVNGPGSFTGVRTSVLIVNTLNFVIKKYMTPVSYFELFDNYPIIKSSSRRDHFIKKSKESEIEIINNTDLEQYFQDNNIKNAFGNSSYIFKNTRVLEKIDYNSIIEKVQYKQYTKIEPLYIKKPNIL